jgi:hypothetical protein
MLMPHSITHGDACLAYFNKIRGIPARESSNQYCALAPGLESVLRFPRPKIVLQHIPPESGAKADIAELRVRADSGLVHRSKVISLNHLVGTHQHC